MVLLMGKLLRKTCLPSEQSFMSTANLEKEMARNRNYNENKELLTACEEDKISRQISRTLHNAIICDKTVAMLHIRGIYSCKFQINKRLTKKILVHFSTKKRIRPNVERV